MFPSLFTGVPFVKTNRLQALAIAGTKRSPLLPDVPTLKEMGVAGVEVEQWYAIFAPAKTPKEMVTKLNQALNKVLEDKEIIKRIEGHGADVETSTPEQLGEMVRKDLVKWRQVVQRAKLQAD
jgi:tripartite-type tricarboxylate transporter receptor subunit TctC